MATTNHVSQLQALEAEAIFLIREVAAEVERPALLFDGDAESAALLRLAEKAFRPGAIPFPILHLDGAAGAPDQVELRDRLGLGGGHELIVASVLLAALEEHGIDALFSGATRAAGGCRGDEHLLSFRDEFGQWEPGAQRPEPWLLTNAQMRRGESVRVFPLSDWTERDIWRYVEAEGIELAPALNPPRELPGGERDLLRLMAAGSVGDGKSTLLDRLADEAPAGAPAARDEPDVSYRYFSTPRRSFILADTPPAGDARTIFTAASTADVALVLVDARHGVVRQTRHQAQISALLGVSHMLVCVNKMDLVAWDEQRFREIADEAYALARRLGVPDLLVVPIGALDGDNVAAESTRTPFYVGPTVLRYLEEVDLQAQRDLWRLRLPVQAGLSRPEGEERLYAGRISSGTLRVGDAVTILPSGQATTVTGLDPATEGVQEAVPPLSVAVAFADRLELERGDMIVGPADQPPRARELECTICWMSDEPLHVGRRYALKHTTRTVRATVREVVHRIDPETLERDIDSVALGFGDIGQVRVRTSAPVFADAYAESRETGSFILIDEASHETVAAAVITSARAIELGRPARRDITWHASALDRDDRWLAIDQRGGTVLLTGFSASGKSTIAVALERRLVESGQAAYLLDGDNIRHGLSEDLGFSEADRTEHIRRVGQVARLLADAGTIAVVSLIAPLAADREHLRAAHAEAKLPFVEVFVDTPLAECERRDPKGLYARARAGEISGFTGIDAPYERPERPELRVDTTQTNVPQAVDQIIELLRARPSVLAKGATMRISAKGDYAVRAGIELAAAEGSPGISAEEIASNQAIPPRFLENILSELSTAGIVQSRRAAGRRTYRLAKPASAINVADVIRAVEGPLTSVHGERPEQAVYPGPAAELPRVWIALRKNLRNVVELVTLADIASAKLPESIAELASDSEAWITR